MPSLHSRRTLILGVGGSLALLAGAGVWRVTRLPTTAIQPWKIDPTPLNDIRLEAFRYAILAPNPHNRQPWQIRLMGTDHALLTCDLDRRLPMTDPFDRQIVIGFGCFIELAVLAAAQRGYRVTVQYFPEGAPEVPQRLDGRPLARLSFTKDPSVQPDPLFSHILHRRTAKIPYALDRKVPPEALSALAAVNGSGVRTDHTVEPEKVALMRQLTLAAWDIEYKTKRTWMETVDLIRVGATEINANPDGVSIKGPLFEALSLLGTDAVRAQAADPTSGPAISTVARYRQMLGGTPAFLWLTSAGNSRQDHLNAGRAYLRHNLIATSFGLSMQPVSQALQEYPEMVTAFADVHELCGIRGPEKLQMLSRLGYAGPVDPTPRWPVETKIRAG